MNTSRLSAGDAINLAAEAPGVPMHMTVVATLDGDSLYDAAGRFRLAAIRHTVENGVAALPRLREVLREPGPFAGRPIWVDAERFDVRRHVGRIAPPEPVDERQLLEIATGLMVRPLDRRAPLWRMVFVTGLREHRVGLIVVVHHVVADGLAATALLLSLLDRPLVPDSETPAADTARRPEPTWFGLALDNARATVRSAGRALASLRGGRPPGAAPGAR